MRLVVAVIAATIVAPSASAGLIAHYPPHSSRAVIHHAQIVNLKHARYVCRHGGGHNKFWSCKATIWLANEAAETADPPPRPDPAPGIYAQASWYGPGLYGNGMACGGTLTTSTVGVAHKSLPCGTRLTVCYQGRCSPASVVDRGPYVSGRDFDLTGALAYRIGFGGVGTISYSIP